MTGNNSILTNTLFPALRLTRSKQWEVALLDFTTYNSIPNVSEGLNNKLYYYETNEDKEKNHYKYVTLPTGSYEIEDINRKLQETMGKGNITLNPNNNLLRSELTSKYYIDFGKDCNIGSLLGFPKLTGVLEPNKLHLSSETANIANVNTINIACNIVDGSYANGEKIHLLHTFYPSVPPGFKITERPQNLLYLPLNTSYISDIVVNIVDQAGRLVDFRGETIAVRLNIKASV